MPGELSTTFHLRARGAAIQGVHDAWVSCASSARRRGWERGSGEAVQAAPGRPRTPFATLNRRGAARLRGVARPPGAGTGVCSTHGRHRILAGTASGASGEHVYRSEALFLRSSGSLRLELKTRKKNVRTASADPFTRARYSWRCRDCAGRVERVRWRHMRVDGRWALAIGRSRRNSGTGKGLKPYGYGFNFHASLTIKMLENPEQGDPSTCSRLFLYKFFCIQVTKVFIVNYLFR